MWPVGVSEVHLILGTTLFLMLGAAPAAIGLAAGLLVQGLFFAPVRPAAIRHERDDAAGAAVRACSRWRAA